MIPSEHNEQCDVMVWWNEYCLKIGVDARYLFAVPNGGKRAWHTAALLKAEGVRAGVPDLFLSIPALGYHGMYIEMKRSKGGRLSEDQKAMIDLLSTQGYLCMVCHGADEAIKAIRAYLALTVSDSKGQKLYE